MDGIRQYLLRLICAALVCGMATGLLGKKGALGATVKLITGIFMILTLVSPFLNFRIGDLSDYLENISTGGNGLVADGQRDAAAALEKIIKEKTEAYILDKAKSFGAELTVEVRLEGSELPVPCGVTLHGSISPYGKRQLSTLIAGELGIAMEEQTWTG